MLTLKRKAYNAHYIDRGFVGCPRQRRDVDLDVCLACPFLEDVQLAGPRAHVRCNPPARVPAL